MKKTISMLVVLALVLSLAACGGAEKKDDKSMAGTTLTIFGNIGSAEGYSVVDEMIIDGFKEKTGIQVEIQTASGSGYLEQLQLMIASGEYPDAALFPSTTVQAYIDVVEAGKVHFLDEYLTEENAPNLMASTYATAWEGVKPLKDGKIYAIPRTSLTRNEGTFVRADWLRNVGMGDILDRTLHEISAEEFQEMAKRFTMDDPDNNGKNDTLATACWTDDTTKQFGPFEFVRGFFGDYGWYAYEGEDYEYMMPMYSKKSDIYKKQLQYTQDLFKAGYLDPDGPSMNKTAVSDNFAQQRYGINPGFIGGLPGEEEKIIDANGGLKNPEGLYVDYIFAKDDKGYVAGNGYYKPMFGQWCVFTACENPNAFVQFCDYMLSDEIWDMIANGIEGVTYTKIGNLQEPIAVEPGEQARGASFPAGIVRKAGSRDYFANTSRLNEKKIHTAEAVEIGFTIGQITQVDALDNGFVPEVASETRFINAQDELAKTVSQICANRAKVSEYDKALNNWYKEGGKEYIEQMNEYISGNQKSESAPEIEKPLKPSEWNAAYAAQMQKQ